jgi:hypothetical protein
MGEHQSSYQSFSKEVVVACAVFKSLKGGLDGKTQLVGRKSETSL